MYFWCFLYLVMSLTKYENGVAMVKRVENHWVIQWLEIKTCDHAQEEYIRISLVDSNSVQSTSVHISQLNSHDIHHRTGKQVPLIATYMIVRK
jgi:hypothetical protein